MPNLILMRHANAEMSSTGMRDFDRPLSKAGHIEAQLAAKKFINTGFTIFKHRPLKIFCSPARRTVETLTNFRETIVMVDEQITYSEELYSGDVSSYQNLLSSLDNNDSCMIIGHNPMIEHFAFGLLQNDDESGINQLKNGFPTAAIAIIQLGNPFNALNLHNKLRHFLSAQS